MALALKACERIRLYPSLLNLRYSSQIASNRKGLVLGVYTNKNEDGVELTPAAECYNKITQGKLLEQIKL
nr:unnamed protein product [Callosobruchus analis]